jgi:DNA polymerase-3 subunit delta
VLVRELLVGGSNRPIITALLAYLPRLPATTVLVLIESGKVRDTNAVMKWVRSADKNSARARLFERPKEAALDRWIVKQVQERGGQIEGQATRMLAVNVGNDLRTLHHEIEKLTLYRNGELIRSADVTLLSPYVAAAGIFDLVDAIGNQDGRNAARLFHELLAQGSDPFYLFSMFIRQFRLLIQARELLDERHLSADIARLIGVHPFVAGKLAQQARRFTLPDLEAIHTRLLEIDLGVKTGRTDLATALQLLIASSS